MAVQISQNTVIAKAQPANEDDLVDKQLEPAMTGGAPGDSWIKAGCVPEQISETAAVVLGRCVNFGTMRVRRLREMAKIGSAVEQLLGERIARFESHPGNGAGRRSWDRYRCNGTDSELARIVDGALSDADYRQNRAHLEVLMAHGSARQLQDMKRPVSGSKVTA